MRARGQEAPRDLPPARERFALAWRGRHAPLQSARRSEGHGVGGFEHTVPLRSATRLCVSNSPPPSASREPRACDDRQGADGR